MLAAAGGYSAATGNLDSFVGGVVGGVVGSAVGDKINSWKASSGATATGGSAAETIQEAVDTNPQDLQGAIDAGRSAGGEAGVGHAAQAVAKVEIDVRGAVQKTMLGAALDVGETIKVSVPYAQKGSVVSSVGRAGVFRGGANSIVNRAVNALGVAAKVAGKTLGAVDAFTYGKSAASAYRRGDWLTFSHDVGMSGLSAIGVFFPGVGKVAPYLGTAMDVGTKTYGNTFIP
jgi:hypothetical protein